jgi:hypothetical protein
VLYSPKHMLFCQFLSSFTLPLPILREFFTILLFCFNNCISFFCSLKFTSAVYTCTSFESRIRNRMDVNTFPEAEQQ